MTRTLSPEAHLSRRALLKAATLGAIGLTAPLPVLRGIPMERAQSLVIVPEYTVQKMTAYLTYSNEVVWDDLPWFFEQAMKGGISNTPGKTWTYTPEVA